MARPSVSFLTAVPSDFFMSMTSASAAWAKLPSVVSSDSSTRTFQVPVPVIAPTKMTNVTASNPATSIPAVGAFQVAVPATGAMPETSFTRSCFAKRAMVSLLGDIGNGSNILLLLPNQSVQSLSPQQGLAVRDEQVEGFRQED